MEKTPSTPFSRTLWNVPLDNNSEKQTDSCIMATRAPGAPVAENELNRLSKYIRKVISDGEQTRRDLMTGYRRGPLYGSNYGQGNHGKAADQSHNGEPLYHDDRHGIYHGKSPQLTQCGTAPLYHNNNSTSSSRSAPGLAAHYTNDSFGPNLYMSPTEVQAYYTNHPHLQLSEPPNDYTNPKVTDSFGQLQPLDFDYNPTTWMKAYDDEIRAEVGSHAHARWEQIRPNAALRAAGASEDHQSSLSDAFGELETGTAIPARNAIDTIVPQGHGPIINQKDLHMAAVTYDNTVVTDQATAFLGNIQGGVHVQNIYQLTSNKGNGPVSQFSRRIERHNDIQEGRTIETVTEYDLGGDKQSRGASKQIRLVWHKEEEIGAGIFGVVHREECRDEQVLQHRAVKVLRLAQLRRFKIDYQKEIGALLRLSQPQNVHRFVEFFSWYEHRDAIHLAMEYLQHGDLERYTERYGNLDLDTVKQIGHQVMDGICIMHKQDIIHRDLKPGWNIFIVQRTPTWKVKIGDFGVCKSTLTDLTTLHTTIGTAGYQAPEVLGLIATTKSGQYDAKCDVWSFGCTIVKLLTGRLPFNTFELARECNAPEAEISSIENGITDQRTRQFLSTLLQCSPALRPSSETAMRLLQASWSLTADTQDETLQKDASKNIKIVSAMGYDQDYLASEANNARQQDEITDIRSLKAIHDRRPSMWYCLDPTCRELFRTLQSRDQHFVAEHPGIST